MWDGCGCLWAAWCAALCGRGEKSMCCSCFPPYCTDTTRGVRGGRGDDQRPPMSPSYWWATWAVSTRLLGRAALIGGLPSLRSRRRWPGGRVGECAMRWGMGCGAAYVAGLRAGWVGLCGLRRAEIGRRDGCGKRGCKPGGTGGMGEMRGSPRL